MSRLKVTMRKISRKLHLERDKEEERKKKERKEEEGEEKKFCKNITLRNKIKR